MQYITPPSNGTKFVRYVNQTRVRHGRLYPALHVSGSFYKAERHVNKRSHSSCRAHSDCRVIGVTRDGSFYKAVRHVNKRSHHSYCRVIDEPTIGVLYSCLGPLLPLPRQKPPSLLPFLVLFLFTPPSSPETETSLTSSLSGSLSRLDVFCLFQSSLL